MTNEQILNEKWKNTNKYLIEWLNGYNKINRRTKDNIQNILNSIKITYSELNKHVSNSEKDKVDRFILELQEKGLLKGYFGYGARLILNKKHITYREMIEFLILASYMEENNSLMPINMNLYKIVSKEHYEMGLKDIGNKTMSFKLPILYTILNIPLLNATAEAYLMALAEQNAIETYKHTLTCLQLGKELNVDNKSYEELFRKQSNKYLCISEDKTNEKKDIKSISDNQINNKSENAEVKTNFKTSGAIENIVESIANQSYLQAGIDTNTKECIFIAEMDNKTTRMCETLNNQVFKLNEMNTYQRYSEEDKKIIVYNTKGLQIGQNLPPINNHFHWCRSTITYLTNLSNKEYDKVRTVIKPITEYEKEQYERYKLYFENEVPGTIEKFVEMKYNNTDEWKHLKQNYQYVKHRYNAILQDKLDKNISVNDYVRKVHEIRKELLNYKMYDNSQVKEIAYHFYDRMIGNPNENRVSVSLTDIKDTLSNIKELKYRENGTIRIVGKNCQVVFNPTSFKLIGVIPKRYKK